ncbi:hypothetical protein PSYMO_32464, partial [Pseudomonas amygdali pv. mori str. 301020]
ACKVSRESGAIQFKESGGMHSKEYAEILVEVKAAIVRLSK